MEEDALPGAGPSTTVLGPKPTPFVEPVHEFGSFDEAAAWLGHPDTGNMARVA